MAEKSFGVKEINLIGGSGTPTIESPNNLNLNAVNVAISTNATIGGNLTVTGTVGIAGTLTYEDVTNIDAIGIITARTGVEIGDTSNTTYRVQRSLGASGTKCGLALNSGGSLDLFTGTGGAGTSRISISNTGNIQFGTLGSTYFLLEDYVTHAGDTDTQFGFDTSNSYIVKTGGTTRLAVNLSGIQVTGTVAATQLNGAGSAITNLSAANLNGTLPSNIGFGTAIAAVWHVGHTGASNYNITGPGNLNNAVNPDLYLERNKVYQFNMNASGHGFGIQTSSGTWNSSNEYTTGITNARASTGIIRFSVPNNAPSTLYYACTSSHSGMVGTIYIYGGSSTVTVSTNADNRVITGGSGGNLNGEANLIFTGTRLGLNNTSPTPLNGDGTGMISVAGGNPEVVLVRTTSGTEAKASIRVTDGEDFKIAVKDGSGSTIDALAIDTGNGQVHIGDSIASSGTGALNIKTSSAGTFFKFRSAADFDGSLEGTALDSRVSANTASKDLVVRSQTLVLWQGSTEKLRLGSAGQLGISGANYGTSGQVLSSTGSSTGVSWKTPLSVLISSTTVSSEVSSVTFTEALTGAFSDYGIYIVTINGLRFANDDRDLHCRIRTGTDGATQLSSSDYLSMTNGPSADDGFSAASQWRFNYNNIGNEIAGSYIRETFNAVIYFYGFEANKRCRYHGTTTYQSSDGSDRGQFINGTVTDASETTGLQFFSSSGNIALGKFSLFGVNG